MSEETQTGKARAGRPRAGRSAEKALDGLVRAVAADAVESAVTAAVLYWHFGEGLSLAAVSERCRDRGGEWHRTPKQVFGIIDRVRRDAGALVEGLE